MKGFVLLFAMLILFARFSEAQGPIGRIIDRIFNREFKADDSKTTGADVDAVIDANNRFAFDLYRRVSSDEGNLFFSPYSISSALAMTYEGARGETAEAIKGVFYFPETEALRNGYARLYNEMRSGEGYEMNVANALWVQKNYALLEEYLGVIKDYYGGDAENVDFARDPEGSRKIINDWVAEQTKQRIKDLIPPQVITPLTALVITNAIYFKGEWMLQFNKELTHRSGFVVNENRTVEVDMMSLPEQSFRYLDTAEAQVLELPYRGDNTSMVILLPKGDISGFEGAMSYEKLTEYMKAMRETEVDVYLPRFKLEKALDLNDVLMKMGMEPAFSDEADFSGITGRKDLRISDVVHKAFVEVNEEGTEAAAATAVVFTRTAMRRNVFRADHPFIFLIQQNGNLLFMGRVTDPSA